MNEKQFIGEKKIMIQVLCPCISRDGSMNESVQRNYALYKANAARRQDYTCGNCIYDYSSSKTTVICKCEGISDKWEVG
jgi:hypothetical protein